MNVQLKQDIFSLKYNILRKYRKISASTFTFAVKCHLEVQ